MTSSPEESSTPEIATETEKSALPVDSLVLHATDNQVSWITLNRPESLNAITPDQRERLIQLFSRAREGWRILTATDSPKILSQAR